MNFAEMYSKEMYISLKGLINKNNGFYKSAKQRSFIESKIVPGITDYATYRELDTDCERVIIAKTTIDFAEGYNGIHKGYVEQDYAFILDDYGITELWKVTAVVNDDRTGLRISKTEKLFQRDPELDLPEFEAEKLSEYVGEVDDQLTAEVTLEFRSTFNTRYGESYIYKFKDSDDNILVWFTSSFKEWQVEDDLEIKFKVKDHEVYNNEKQTKIYYVKEV